MITQLAIERDTTEAMFEIFFVLLWKIFFVFRHILSIMLMYYLVVLGGVWQIFVLIYIIFIIIEMKSEVTLSRRWSLWFQSLSCWQSIANYFPIKLIKTADLPPTKNYLFAAFPHGFAVYGYLVNFLAKATHFRDFYPGIELKVCTLSNFFWIPLFREIYIALDLIPASHKTIVKLLSQEIDQKFPISSNATMIVVGGVREMLYSSPGRYKIVIKNRKGFVRIALATGASLVPVFSFGEVDSFDLQMMEPKTNGALKYWPQILIRCTKVGIFPLLPKRAPINTVVGAPIDVQKVSNPSQKQIDELHQKYMKELEKLFNEHKIKFVKNPNETKLEMV